MKVICNKASNCAERCITHGYEHDKNDRCDDFCAATQRQAKCIPIKKESPMEYELLGPVSIKALEEAGACERELHRFAFFAINMGLPLHSTTNLDITEVVSIAKRCKNGIPWLIEKGFIREKEEQLKCCPFCSYNIIRVDKLDDGRHHVICQNCGATVSRNMRYVAIMAWNARV